MNKDKFYDAVHIIGGVLAACVCPWYPVLSVTAIFIFGVYEYWQAKRIGDRGWHDFWGGVLGYFIGLSIVLVLKLTGVI